MENSDKNLKISRVVDAPIDKVWQAWTDPEKIKKWWGPKDVSSIVNEWELREGGNIDIVMIAGEELGELSGQEWPMTGTFEEIDEKEKKLSFRSSAVMNGKPILETLCTLTLESEDNGKTKMNFRVVITKTTPEAAGALSGMEIGWNQQLDKLNDLVK